MSIDDAIQSARRHHLAGDLREAELSYKKILEVQPDNPAVYLNLGDVFRERKQLYEAEDNYRKALELDPGLSGALNRLGMVFQAKGRIDDAVEYYMRAVRESPEYGYHRALVLAMLYSSRWGAQEIFSEHLRLAARFEKPLFACFAPHSNRKDPRRRLKIGYVSPDFRRHSVAYFIEPILASHEREHFEIFCFPLLPREDEVTVRIKRHADHWESIAGMEDEHAAELIRSHGIDILVDLAGHTYNSRILLFARKPAPVQASWIGYPATTGFSLIDYKIVDNRTDPPDMTDQYYSERLMRLPDSFLCYLPDAESPDVGPLPALTSGEMTLGSFNDFTKITPEVVALWSEILRRIPDSLLVLKAISFTDRGLHRTVRERFAEHGIDSGRIELIPFASTFRAHLGLYSQIDIGLDPFPYNGTTTTCEALWMGVPVVTLAGDSHLSRVGMSLLSNIGLPELIAGSPGEYVETVVRLASDIQRLEDLRGQLRDRMSRSPLTDAKRITRDLEECYRRMWTAWCGSEIDRP